MRILVTGATGQIGHGAVTASLADPGVQEVRVLSRRPTGWEHPKLREILHSDFLDYGPVESDLTGIDACFWCLGISAAGLDEEDYRRITHGFPLAAASTLHRLNPGLSFIYISGGGAGLNSRQMWARVKAEAERDLGRLPIEQVICLRPAVVFPVDGAISSTRSYRIMYGLMRPFRSMFKAILPGQVSTSTEVGKAMLAAFRNEDKRGVLESREMLALLS